MPPEPIPTELDLVTRALAGHGASLAAAFERRRPRLLAAALRIVRTLPDAQDAVQDTFLTALAHLAELRDPNAFGGWLLAILRNCCLQQLRSRRPEVLVADLPDDAVVDADFEERVGRHALRDWVIGQFARLPEPLRLTAALRYFGTYASYLEVATILDVPVGTVRSRLSDVKRRLADAVLVEAGLAAEPADPAADDRLARYGEALSGLEWQRRQLLLADCEPGLKLVFAQADRPARHVRGREHLAADWRDDLEHGVRYRLRSAFGDRAITVLEAELLNDPQYPAHCPPGGVLVLLHGASGIERAHVYVAARPPETAPDFP